MNLRITTRERIHPCCLCHKRLFTLCLLQKVEVKNNRGRAAFWLLAFVCCWARKRGRKSQQSWVLCRGAVPGTFFPPHTAKRWMSRLWVSGNIWILFHDTCWPLCDSGQIYMGFQLAPGIWAGSQWIWSGNAGEFNEPKVPQLRSANTQFMQCLCSSGCNPYINKASRQRGILTDLAEYPEDYYVFKNIFVVFW